MISEQGRKIFILCCGRFPVEVYLEPQFSSHASWKALTSDL